MSSTHACLFCGTNFLKVGSFSFLISLAEMLRAMRDNAASNEEAIASIQKALDIEIRVRNGAERLSQTYKDGPRNCLESARKQLEVAEAKIGFLRNQLARLKHAGVRR